MKPWLAVPLCLGLSGCPGLVPGSRPYRARDDAEKELLSQAHRDVFPDDVRADLEGHRDHVVLWSSIVKAIDESDPSAVTVRFEHHYWDFIEDYSVQKAIAFLSPRGEGDFEVAFSATPGFAVGDMALVYGTPERVEPDGTIVLAPRSVRTLRKELYATDVWDYGRAYLLEGDTTDFKVLRVPLR
jgi:hypothetical protein